MSSSDLFDAYFQRADIDRDGRISGQEAVSFFQGANLPREVLAKIWQYSDQGQTGYLSRAEFYNALKLVTVAQRGRELTPAIVNSALNGPAASQIPPPQIQFPPGQSLQHAPPAQHQGRPAQPMGYTPQLQQYPSTNASVVPRPEASASLLKQGSSAALRAGNVSTDWPTNKSSSWSGPSSNNNLIGAQVSSSTPLGASPAGALFPGANSASLNSDKDFFGGDVFTAVPTKPSVVSSQALPSSTGLSSSQPAGTSTQNLKQRDVQRIDQSNFSVDSSLAASKVAHSVTAPHPQHDRGVGLPPGIDTSKSWPKMNDVIVRRYTKIFIEVDTDRDGKISGVQARDLFLSWHLPREVLKQIWDLSDQDHDSMLSLSEFCVALHLMERHREHRALPAAMPAAFYFDESGVQALGMSEAQVSVAQNSTGYNTPAWRPNAGVLQTSGTGLPPRPVSHGITGHSSVRPPMPGSGRGRFVPPQMQGNKAPLVGDMKLDPQLAMGDQSVFQNKHLESAATEKEVEKRVMDSKEKMEFYRTKLQDFVLFKTRCDNRVAETVDKAAADKREVESLAKRYDEKYKQAGESQARLLADEAAFRVLEERRVELHSALLRMEQGGDLNAFLQVRADRLQNDLDELKKALNVKCKQHGLRIKPISLLEIPFGWQPGIQESAAEWDESWDKFEEEGFGCVQDFMEEGTPGSDTSKPKSVANWDETEEQDDSDEQSTVINSHNEAVSDKIHEDASSKAHTDNEGDHGSENEVSSSEHERNETQDLHKFEHKPSSPKSEFDDSNSNDGDWSSVFSHTKDIGETNSSWGGTDSLHANTSNHSKTEQPNGGATFEFDDPFDKLSHSGHVKDDLPTFGPIRTKERSSVFFDSSVPSTPLYTSYSPVATSRGSFFDESVPSTPASSNHGSTFGTNRGSFARFDSFSSVNSDFPNASDSFARFDSFNYANSTASRGFTSFEQPELSGTSSFGGQHVKHSTDTWNAFS
ncbi:hypothetical protein KP509_17G032800 [Ceratopteris richardii]|uniref:Uncharacterized protein n=1 Tax=Ceratopteris richardii TaxID=49495 RepID=A0A8T2SWV4_CERRI|nr:hypothetical protein KP509_17G032800 [Ceratopteris richardii]